MPNPEDTKQNIAVHSTQAVQPESKPVIMPSSKVGTWKSDRAAALAHLRQYPLDLTLDFLAENSLPVYIKNTISNGSVILITLIDPSGRRSSHRVEKTWIPQVLSERYSYETLLRSDDLKDHIFKRSIILIHPEDAVKELQSERAQAVLRKFQSRFAGNAPQAVLTPELSTKEVTERMKSLAHRIITGDLKDDDAITEILNNFVMFGQADFYYLYENFASKPEFRGMIDEVRKEAVRQGKHE